MAIEFTSLPMASATNNSETTQTTSGGKSGSASENQARAEVPTHKVTSDDSVTLTNSAVNLSMIEANINAQSVIDNDRVNSLKLAIENGQYDFNAMRVAEKFLQFELQL